MSAAATAGIAWKLARRFPDLCAVVFDLPPVIEVTRDLITEAGLGDRVTACAGDFHTDPLGSGHDIALLFGVLVSEDERAGTPLLHAVRESLNLGGYLIARSLRRTRRHDRDGVGAVRPASAPVDRLRCGASGARNRVLDEGRGI